MNTTMEMEETRDLVASDLVIGTDDVDGESFGSIERLVLDKLNGTVAYAVLSFGGFLGIGNGHDPLPWHRLHYDESLGASASTSPMTRSRGLRRTRNPARRTGTPRRAGSTNIIRRSTVAACGRLVNPPATV